MIMANGVTFQFFAFSIALPSLLCFNIDRLHRKALQCEIETLQSMIETLRKEIQTSDAEISSLRDQVPD